VRVLVTGAGGLVGGRLAAILHAKGFDVLATYRSAAPPSGPRSIRIDLADDRVLSRLLDAERPEAVVHAAALAQIDRCCAQPDAATSSNVRLPGRLAQACRERGLRLVALSTDLVFSGDRAPLGELDAVGPLSVYGRTKLAGEKAVLAAYPEAAIARIALVIGRGHGPRASASESVAWALRAGQSALLFSDEYRTPVDPESVAQAVTRLIELGGAGLFHLGGPERLSRYELGRRVARALGLEASDLLAGRQADHEAKEPRPADVSLDSSRARRELAWEPRPLDEALRESRLSPAG
jgi:dTDP-4-dehydrorhamnose reductase